MALTLKPGWLYFLDEVDFQSGKRTGYVKIGKTDYNRTVSTRVKEHQTANPRRVIELDSMRTPFIDPLETHLHHHFAAHRVHGEWFRFDSKLLKQAIAEARRVNAEMVAVENKAKRAERFAPDPSDGSTKSPSKQAKRLHAEFIAAEKQRSRLMLEKTLVEIDLRRLTSDTAGIASISTQIVTSPKPSLDRDALLAARPGIYGRFIVQKTRLSSRFTIQNRPTAAKAHGVLKGKVDAARGKLAEVKAVRDREKRRSASSKRLHEEWLVLHARIAHLSWMTDRIVVELKSQCGTADGIEHVCNWKRSNVTSDSFDGGAFKKKHPIIWKRFSTTANPVVRFKVLDHKPY